METRILTLFDDEAFVPKQEPKEKPQKEKASNAALAEPELSLLFEEEKEEPEIAQEESSIIDVSNAVVPQDIAEEKPEAIENTTQPEATEPAAALPKPAGFTPRFKAAALPKAAEEKTIENSEPAKSEAPPENTETTPAQPYKPRFKPQMPRKPEQ